MHLNKFEFNFELFFYINFLIFLLLILILNKFKLLKKTYDLIKSSFFFKTFLKR